MIAEPITQAEVDAAWKVLNQALESGMGVLNGFHVEAALKAAAAASPG